ncbi:tetratricopeptide repeat protein [uncultured Brachyspira sp.]|uniref:tetratricopeptide repeat protein n=1 Tax=uncultured Brachyspira sp. TaxID=221953 RepID=UPI0025FAF1A2|nr:tetratricopeptide repeat protein [uncultured Brachyspira sp.]
MLINEYINSSYTDEDIKEIIKESNDIVADKINKLIDINNMLLAKKLALELIKKDNNYKYGYLVLADIYYEEEDYKSVIELLDNALNFIKDDKDLLESKIDALISCCRYNEAENIIEKLIYIGNADSSIYGQYGVILSIEGKYDKAIDMYKKAVSIDNEDVLSMINMSVAYRAMYRYDDAIDILYRALTVKRNDANIINRINNIKYLKESSEFYIDKFVSIQANPDRFHLLVPENFNASIEGSVLKIESHDSRISIIISYSNKKYNEDAVKELFSGFRGRRGELYSVITPISVRTREKHSDLFAEFIFISKINKNDFFNAIALSSKGEEAIILTISSTVSVSDRLISFAKEVINSLYIK